jgi:hypothetical protein
MTLNGINLKGMGLEYKSGAVFGVMALFLSIIFGILAGNGIGTILLKTGILSLVFVAIGYGIVLVIRKYVPELYDAINGILVSVPVTDGVVETDKNQKSAAAAPGEVSGTQIPEQEKQTDEFVPMKDSDFVKTEYSSEKGKMGKHYVVDEKKFKYEPKIMAEAIKTMMKKDTQ